MRNLARRRAENAIAHAANVTPRDGQGDALSGYPGLIVNNGLLLTLAYSIDKQALHLRIAEAISSHLATMPGSPFHGRPPHEQNSACLLNFLTTAPDSALRHCTEEALAFLAYLKRLSD